jgi:uncharacterized UBP type Zn finger protein
LHNIFRLFRSITRNVKRFRGFQQQDAHDLLMNLLELLENETDKENQESVPAVVFGGEVCSTGNLINIFNIVLCLTCNQVSRSIDPINNIILEISFEKNRRRDIKEIMEEYLLAHDVATVRQGGVLRDHRHHKKSKYIFSYPHNCLLYNKSNFQ